MRIFDPAERKIRTVIRLVFHYSRRRQMQYSPYRVPRQGVSLSEGIIYNGIPYFFAKLDIAVNTVPQADYILALPYTNRTTTDLGPVGLIRRPGILHRILRGTTHIELVSDNCQDEILPDPVRHALL